MPSTNRKSLTKKTLFLILAVVCLTFSTVLTGCLQEKKVSSTTEAEIKKTDAPFLWKIESTKNSYLFGTVHLRDDRVLNLNESVKEALNNADVVYTERKFDDETKIKMALSSRLNEGKNVEDIISENLSQKLEKYLEDQGLSEYQIEDFKNYKIWVIAISLSTVKDQLDNLGEPILDEYIWQTAEEKGKETYGLETTGDQLNIFGDLSIKNQTYLLNETLNQLIQYEEEGENPVELTLEAYLAGNAEKIYELTYSYFNESNPVDVKLNNKLFIERNKRMASRIAEVVLNNPDKSYFFAIGAGHFCGENSLLHFLNEEFE
ncbi:MAG: TraB/GumN family protein [Candidatus Thermoplasmatota archaeon]